MKLLWFSCCRLRLLPHGVAMGLRGNRFSTEAGLLLEINLGFAEVTVESGRGHIAQDQLGTCQDDRGGGVGERRTVRGRHFQACCRTSPVRTRKWVGSPSDPPRCRDLTLVGPEVVFTKAGLLQSDETPPCGSGSG